MEEDPNVSSNLSYRQRRQNPSMAMATLQIVVDLTGRGDDSIPDTNTDTGHMQVRCCRL
jgi:hypothetical protein